MTAQVVTEHVQTHTDMLAVNLMDQKKHTDWITKGYENTCSRNIRDRRGTKPDEPTRGWWQGFKRGWGDWEQVFEGAGELRLLKVASQQVGAKTGRKSRVHLVRMKNVRCAGDEGRAGSKLRNRLCALSKMCMLRSSKWQWSRGVFQPVTMVTMLVYYVSLLTFAH